MHMRTLILTNFNGKFSAKILISSDWNELSSCLIWRFDARSSDYQNPKNRIRMAENDVYIAQSSTRKTHYFAISAIIIAIVEANIEIFKKCFVLRTYIGKLYNIAA